MQEPAAHLHTATILHLRIVAQYSNQEVHDFYCLLLLHDIAEATHRSHCHYSLFEALHITYSESIY